MTAANSFAANDRKSGGPQKTGGCKWPYTRVRFSFNFPGRHNWQGFRRRRQVGHITAKCFCLPSSYFPALLILAKWRCHAMLTSRRRTIRQVENSAKCPLSGPKLANCRISLSATKPLSGQELANCLRTLEWLKTRKMLKFANCLTTLTAPKLAIFMENWTYDTRRGQKNEETRTIFNFYI